MSFLSKPFLDQEKNHKQSSVCLLLEFHTHMHTYTHIFTRFTPLFTLIPTHQDYFSAFFIALHFTRKEKNRPVVIRGVKWVPNIHAYLRLLFCTSCRISDEVLKIMIKENLCQVSYN